MQPYEQIYVRVNDMCGDASAVLCGKLSIGWNDIDRKFDLLLTNNGKLEERIALMYIFKNGLENLKVCNKYLYAVFYMKLYLNNSNLF